jgi:hypothetical protein
MRVNPMAERIFIGLLAATNLIAGFGGAILLATQLGEISGRPRNIRYFVLFVFVYFLECVAFSAGMATQVFSVGLAFVWGIVFGLRLRGRAAPRKVLKTSFLFSLYTTLPTVTFSILLLIAFAVGGSIVSVEEARKFGIPDFVPWPFNTVLGFCAALAAGTVMLKTVITTGEVGLLIHLGKTR